MCLSREGNSVRGSATNRVPFLFFIGASDRSAAEVTKSGMSDPKWKSKAATNDAYSLDPTSPTTACISLLRLGTNSISLLTNLWTFVWRIRLASMSKARPTAFVTSFKSSNIVKLTISTLFDIEAAKAAYALCVHEVWSRKTIIRVNPSLLIRFANSKASSSTARDN